jgi:hypothetical protein
MMMMTTMERCVILLPRDGFGALAEEYKVAVEAALVRSDRGGPKQPRKQGSGRPRVTDKFPDIVTCLQAFVDAQSSHAQDRRRDTTARLITPSGGEAEGFRLVDAHDDDSI